MVFKVKVNAIYERFGVAPAAARITQRDSDVTLAQQRAALVAHYTPAVAEEFITPYGNGAGTAYERYGFGWVAVQWLTVRQDGPTLGDLIFQRLTLRALQDGSYIEVYEHLADEGNPFATGAMLYERRWPRATSPDVG